MCGPLPDLDDAVAVFVAACTAVALSRGGLPASAHRLDALGAAIDALPHEPHPSLSAVAQLMGPASGAISAQQDACELAFALARWDLGTALALFWQNRVSPLSPLHRDRPFRGNFAKRFKQESRRVTDA